MKFFRFLFIAFVVLFPALGVAQQYYPDLVTDRPDQTESAEVVPLKSLQIESGFVVERNQAGKIKQTDLAYNSTLFRYSIIRQLELRIGMEYVGSKTEDQNLKTENCLNGFSALSTGLKLKLRQEDGLNPGVALLGNLAFPITAKDAFKTDHVAAGLRISLSQTLNNIFAVGYNLGAEWDGNSKAPGYFYSVSLGAGLTDRLGMFAESYGLILDKKTAEHLLDAGLTFLILPNLQADLSGGFGLNEPAIDHFVSLGLSYRIPGPTKSVH